MTTYAILVVAVILCVGAVASIATVADRVARAAAWRQIAIERRWNHEQFVRDR